MARIEWVKQRLENWALWHEQEAAGSRGYAKQSVFLVETVDTSGYRESTVPIDDVEAGITNEGVESMRPEHSHLHRTLHLVYLQDSGIKGAGRALGRAESTVYGHLAQADAYLAQWFTARKRRQEEARAAWQAGARKA